MNTSRALLSLIAAVGAFSAGLHAQSGAPAPDQPIAVQVGSLNGRLVTADDESVTVEIAGHTGSRVVLKRELVPADTLYLIDRSRMDPSDPEAWRRLADFAGHSALHVRRMEALTELAKLRPDEADQIRAEIEGCKESCAAASLATARRLLDAGELDQAMKRLQDARTIYKGCVSADEAGRLLDTVQAALKEERARALAIQQARVKVRAAFADLDDVNDLIVQAGEVMQQGRGELDKSVKATRGFLRALALLEKAERRLEDIAPDDVRTDFRQVPEWSDYETEFDRLRLALREELMDVHLELGYVYLNNRGDTKSAIRHAGHAAMLDADDQRVAALRTAIAAYGRQAVR